MASLQQIKSRMKSIETTQKMTNAMQLLASVKLNYWRNRKEENDLYCDETIKIVRSVFLNKKIQSPHTITYETASKKLVIVVTSTLGLCGSYDSSMFSYMKKHLRTNDDVVIIGEKGYEYCKTHYPNIKTLEFIKMQDHLTTHSVHALADLLVKAYPLGEYEQVEILYSKYINAFTFEPSKETIFPIRFTKIGEEISVLRVFEEKMLKDQLGGDIIMVPGEEQLLPELTTLYTTTSLYKALMESFVCEQASRRNAMDSAAKNADELMEELNILYNKKRQENITNEISEIVSGSQTYDN